MKSYNHEIHSYENNRTMKIMISTQKFQEIYTEISRNHVFENMEDWESVDYLNSMNIELAYFSFPPENGTKQYNNGTWLLHAGELQSYIVV